MKHTYKTAKAMIEEIICLDDLYREAEREIDNEATIYDLRTDSEIANHRAEEMFKIADKNAQMSAENWGIELSTIGYLSEEISRIGKLATINLIMTMSF